MLHPGHALGGPGLPQPLALRLMWLAGPGTGSEGTPLAPRDPDPARAGLEIRILYVEDNRGDVELVRSWLAREAPDEFVLEEAPTVGAALERLRGGPPDIVLLDLSLPDARDLGGFERLRALLDRVPVIVLTGRSDADLAARAAERGAQDYLVKGQFTPDALLRSLRYALERHRLADELRSTTARIEASHARLIELIEANPHAVLVVDEARRVRLLNRAAERLLGRSRGELLDALSPVDLGGAGDLDIERPDGERRHVERRVVPFAWRDRPASLVTLTDVTSRRATELALGRERQRLDHVVARGPAIMYSAAADAVASPTFVTRNVESLLGFATTRFTEDAGFWRTRCHPSDRGVFDERRAVLERDDHHAAEYRFRCADGEELWLNDAASAVRDAQGRLVEVVAHCTDVTERRRLEAQLGHSQRLEAIGRLAGGVAHDFNNLLTVVLGYADLMLASEPEGEARDRLEAIATAAEGASQLTRQLLAFGRKQLLAPDVVDLNDIVRDTERMLRPLIGEDVALELELAPEVGRIRVDRGQIEQVLVNLVINARDAMPEGGRVRIATRPVSVLGGERSPADAEPDGALELEVCDTGAGMDEAVRERIFEPFFTTKDVSRGSGLGLSTVYGIVRQSGGSIDVESAPGCGTRFRIRIPLCGEVSTEPRPDTPRRGPGRGTVLIVEDDVAVRELMRQVLVRCGHEVLEAGSGADALAHHGDRRGRIDLVITDAVIPDMRASELVRALRDREAGLPVLCVSGYSDEALRAEGTLLEGIPFLEKPFNVSLLGDEVARLLDDAG